MKVGHSSETIHDLGLSGLLTRATIRSPLTPLFLLAALAAGLVALLTIPREEEPQISVPMVDIVVQANGLKAPDAIELVTKPLEAIVKAISGVEHVYSQTQDDRAVVTVRFDVGTNEDDAVLRVNDKIRANIDKIPIGIPEPLIVGRGINDVAVVVLTLSPKPEAAARWTDRDLYDLAVKLRTELIKIDNIGTSYIVGTGPEQIRVEPDPEKLSLFGVTLQQLIGKVRDANRSFVAGAVRDAGTMRTLAAGQTLRGVPDIGLLLLTTRDNRPVYVRDVAKVVIGPSTAESRVWNLTPGRDGWQRVPAVSLALAKRAGANAVVVSQAIVDRVAALQGRLIPPDVRVEVTRDYGQTANDKANELLFHLALATVSIVVLIALAIGWREAVVTLVVIPTTILLTLFAARLMGYTINRVSLFALIFAIGILVDDAIVVVENIARHWAMRDGRGRMQAAIEAVAEVGNPTVVATLTVIAALLPMLFVSGLMGPVHGADPGQCLRGDAVLVLCRDGGGAVAAAEAGAGAAVSSGGAHHDEGRLGRLYRGVAAAVLRSRARAWTFLLAVGIATIVACAMFYTEAVTVKLLPFDNKSELQVVLNLPEGSSLEDTERTLFAAAAIVSGLPEVRSVQTYAGTAAPFNFDGLVRHYYMRQSPELGDLQINLAEKSARERSSHAIALDLRRRLEALALPEGSTLQVVEVPPGPPVLATLLAEIYGPDAATRRAVAEQMKAVFRTVPFIVDVGELVRPSAAATARGDRSGRTRVLHCRADRCLRHGAGVVRRHWGRIFASRRGARSDRNPHRPAEERSELGRASRRHAGAGQHAARQQDRGRAWPGGSGGEGAGLAGVVPTRRAFRRHGDGGTCRCVRGADLRHDRGAEGRRRARLGQPAEARDQPSRSAVGRIEADAAVGRRMGDHLCHVPRHGCGVRRGNSGYLHPGGGAVP